jgi:hypothetical protein
MKGSAKARSKASRLRQDGHGPPKTSKSFPLSAVCSSFYENYEYEDEYDGYVDSDNDELDAKLRAQNHTAPNVTVRLVVSTALRSHRHHFRSCSSSRIMCQCKELCLHG